MIRGPSHVTRFPLTLLLLLLLPFAAASRREGRSGPGSTRLMPALDWERFESYKWVVPRQQNMSCGKGWGGGALLRAGQRRREPASSNFRERGARATAAALDVEPQPGYR